MNRVYLVGAGCGADTLTVRGARLLAACDCLVYDSLIDAALLRLVKPSCKKIFAGKRAGAHGMEQAEISALLIECGKTYACTVRLKGGDPFVFGRGGEELSALRAAGVYAESVPGVTSAVAAAELSGIPVTHRGVSSAFTVVTAQTEGGRPDFSRLAKAEGTLVFLMGKAAAGKIARGLIAGGMDKEMPAALLSGAGTAASCTVRCPLCRLEEEAEKLPSPLTVLVGKVCALDLSPLRRGPRVLVTGTPSHIARVLPLLEEAGADGRALAHLSVRPRGAEEAFARLEAGRLLVFTSANGVYVFFGAARGRGTDLRLFGGKRFAVIGRATAEALAECGFRADILPSEYTTEALAAAVRGTGIPREEVLLLRAASGGGVLSETGVQVSLYDLVPEEGALAGAEGALAWADAVTFSSAGGVRALLERCSLPAGVLPVAIGEVTAGALRAYGYAPAVAKQADARELAAAVTAAKERRCRD